MVQTSLFEDAEVMINTKKEGETMDNSNDIQSLEDRIAAERIEKTPAMPFTVKAIAKNPNRYRFDLVIQRNLRWTDDQNTAIIESSLLGYPIPPVYSLKSADNDIWMLDGKQRMNAFIKFWNNEFPLEPIPPVFGVDISGMYYRDLPEEFRDIIDMQNITIYQFERLSTAQRDELFKRLNSGTPLSSIELIRSILGTENLDYMNSLIAMPFIQKVGVTEKQREGFKDQELVLQMIAVITGRKYDIGGKALKDIALDLRINGLTDEEKTIVTATFNYLGQAFAEIDDKTTKKVLKKADIIGITGAALSSTDSPGVFGDVLSAFIKVQSTGSAYGKTKNSGSAGADAVKARIELLSGVLAVGTKSEKSA